MRVGAERSLDAGEGADERLEGHRGPLGECGLRVWTWDGSVRKVKEK